MDLGLIEWATRLAHAFSGRRIKSSAMAPLQALCWVAFPAFVAASYAFREQQFLSNFFAILAALPLIVFLGMYVYFGVTEPDRLHTEDYRLRRQMLTITENKAKTLTVEKLSLPEIANPYPEPKAIEHKEAEGRVRLETKAESQEENGNG